MNLWSVPISKGFKDPYNIFQEISRHKWVKESLFLVSTIVLVFQNIIFFYLIDSTEAKISCMALFEKCHFRLDNNNMRLPVNHIKMYILLIQL